jgi:hypothetical protein
LPFFLVVLTSSACNALDAKTLRDRVNSWIRNTYNFEFVGTWKSPKAGTQVFFAKALGAARIHHMITCYELDDGAWVCMIPALGAEEFR